MKNDIRNLVNFRASSRKSENVHFNGLLLSRAYNVLDEKVQKFGYFWPNSRKSKNLHINGLLLTKVYNVWAKKLQRSYVSWHRRVMWYLKKNWLVVWKKTWGIWLIFMRAVASQKICILMGLFCPKHIKF